MTKLCVYRTRLSTRSGGVTTVFSCSVYVTCVRVQYFSAVCSTSTSNSHGPSFTVFLNLLSDATLLRLLRLGVPWRLPFLLVVPIPVLPGATQHAVPFRAEITAPPPSHKPNHCVFPFLPVKWIPSKGTQGNRGHPFFPLGLLSVQCHCCESLLRRSVKLRSVWLSMIKTLTGCMPSKCCEKRETDICLPIL